MGAESGRCSAAAGTRSRAAIHLYPKLGELVDPRRLDRPQREPVEPVDHCAIDTIDSDKVSPLQDLQVLDGSLPRHVQTSRQLSLPLAVIIEQPVEEPATRHVTESEEDVTRSPRSTVRRIDINQIRLSLNTHNTLPQGRLPRPTR